jgi:CBS domain-containing protein
MMRDRNIGDVLVTDSDRQRCGVVTDRGIVLRAFAADDDRAQMTLRDVSFVTIGDLTRAQDSPSALADISAAAPSN